VEAPAVCQILPPSSVVRPSLGGVPTDPELFVRAWRLFVEQISPLSIILLRNRLR
jgi:hypothetical protein